MTADFDWSGAPEGERWVLGSGCYVIDAVGKVHCYGPYNESWFITEIRPDVLRSSPTGARMESARPVPRVGDRVRVTIEGKVLDAREDGLVSDAFEISVGGEGRRFFWPSNDGAQVEVLQRADPPLQPGDFVRDDRGRIYLYDPPSAAGNAGTDAANFRVLIDSNGRQASEGLCNYKRSDLVGPLVKVELREVQP